MIEAVEFCNLGPFRGVQSISLPEGIISIEGRYVDAVDKSNRSGKSFFMSDLLRFAFYGKHRYTQGSKLLHRGADTKHDDFYAAYLLSLEDHPEFLVRRTYDRMGGRFTLDLPTFDPSVTSQLKATELQSLLCSTIGCEYEQAAMSWLVMQDQAAGIMSLDVNTRKSFFLNLFSPVIYPWDSYYAEASARCRTLGSRISEQEARCQMLQQQRQALDPIKLKAFLVELHKAQQRLEQQKEELAIEKSKVAAMMCPEHLEQVRQELAAITSATTSAYGILSATKRHLQGLEAAAQKYHESADVITGLVEKYDEIASTYSVDAFLAIKHEYTSLSNDIIKKNTYLQGLLERISDIDSFQNTDSICPVSGSACPTGVVILGQREQLVTQAAGLEQEIKLLELQQQKLNAQIIYLEDRSQKLAVLDKEIKGHEQIMQSNEYADALILDAKSTVIVQEQEYRRLQEKKEALKKEELQLMDTDLLQFRKKLKTLDEAYLSVAGELRATQQAITNAEADLKGIVRIEAEITAIESELQLQANRLQVLRSLQPALSKDGIPFFGLLTSIAEFEYEVNKALTQLGTDIQVEVIPYSTLTTYEPMCVACGYDFPSQITTCPVCGARRTKKKKETLDIQFKGSAYNVDFSEDSGGGKLLVSLAIRLALFSVFRDRGLMQGIDFWVLDEVFSPLDTSAKTSMLRLLDDLRDTYGFKQLFVISHTDLSDVLPPAVVVERNEDEQCSRLVI